MNQLMETTIPMNFEKGLDEKGLEVGAAHTDKIADILFTTVSNILKMTKSTDAPTVFKFEDMGNTIAVAVVSYHENEDKNKPGNWSYIWSFDENDIPENARVTSISDPTVYTNFVGYAGSKYSMGFESHETMIPVMNYLLQTINNYLISNSTTEAETAVELEGIFQARSITEPSGEVVCSIEVVGETKAIIKSDEDIEK